MCVLILSSNSIHFLALTLSAHNQTTHDSKTFCSLSKRRLSQLSSSWLCTVARKTWHWAPPLHWCFCTAAQEHFTYPLKHNKPRSHNSLTIKCNSHALSHEVAAHVVTIQMQLRVCVRGFFFFWSQNRRIGSDYPHPISKPVLAMTKH